MRPLPTPPAPGKPVSATLIRQLIAAIRERTILSGVNTRLKRTPSGTIIDSIEHIGSKHVCESMIPWKVVSYVDETDDEEKHRFANKILQIGYGVYNYDSDELDEKVAEPDDLEESNYYVEITFDETGPFDHPPSIEIKSGEPEEGIDWDNLIVRIVLGYFDGEKLINGIGHVPVIYGFV